MCLYPEKQKSFPRALFSMPWNSPSNGIGSQTHCLPVFRKWMWAKDNAESTSLMCHQCNTFSGNQWAVKVKDKVAEMHITLGSGVIGCLDAPATFRSTAVLEIRHLSGEDFLGCWMFYLELLPLWNQKIKAETTLKIFPNTLKRIMWGERFGNWVLISHYRAISFMGGLH